MAKKSHPYHYSYKKNLVQKFLDWLVPVALFLLYFKFYNFGKVTPSEMIKTTGLLGISLLSLTLIVGPIAKFFPSLEVLKAHRKFWGVSAFFTALLHFLLVFVFYFKFNFLRLVDITSPKFVGLFWGYLSLVVLLIVALTSHRKAVEGIHPKLWKAIQTTSYLALIFAIIHFYLIEQVNGVFTIKRELGRFTFWAAIGAVLFRLFVLFLPQKRR